MDLKYKLMELKKDIGKEPSYSKAATAKAYAVVDELVRVVTKGYNKVTSPAPSDVTKHFGNSFGSKSVGGRTSINFKIDSIKDGIITSRIIPNDLSQWAVTKLNSIKRM